MFPLLPRPSLHPRHHLLIPVLETPLILVLRVPSHLVTGFVLRVVIQTLKIAFRQLPVTGRVVARATRVRVYFDHEIDASWNKSFFFCIIEKEAENKQMRLV